MRGFPEPLGAPGHPTRPFELLVSPFQTKIIELFYDSMKSKGYLTSVAEINSICHVAILNAGKEGKMNTCIGLVCCQLFTFQYNFMGSSL